MLFLFYYHDNGFLFCGNWPLNSAKKLLTLKEQMAVEKSKGKLKKLGWNFDNSGRLRKLDSSGTITNVGYKDENKDDVVEAIQNYVHALMDEAGLRTVKLGPSFIFASEDFKTCKKLLILIQSSGQLQAGFWSFKNVLNHSLNDGTQMPFVKRAQAAGFGVVILNPNQTDGGMDHIYAAFSFVCKRVTADLIFIVAHGTGGTQAVELSNVFHEEFDKRVKSVQLVDSDHDPALHYVNARLQECSVNYINHRMRINKGIVEKDRFTRQMSRIKSASQSKADTNRREITEEDEKAQEMLSKFNSCHSCNFLYDSTLPVGKARL